MSSARLVAGILGFVLAAGMLSGSPSALAQEPEATRALDGRIVNGTAGAVVEPGLVVTLHRSTPEGTDDEETVTGPEGRFRFEGVAFDSQAVYAATVRYLGILYGVDIDLSQRPPPPVNITVFETGDDLEVLSVINASLLLVRMDDALQALWALEIVKIENRSDRTYVPGPEPMDLLRFGLPPNAQDLNVETGLQGDFIQVNLGFALTASVPPGQHEIMYSYRFPYEGTEAVVSRSFRYGVENLRVLAPLGVAELASAEMGDAEEVMIGERPYHLLTATDLPRGAEISVRLSGLSEPSLGDRLTQRTTEVPYEYAAMLALGVLMVSLLAVALWRRGRAPVRGANDGGGDLLDAERGLLVREIASLQVAFEEGKIDEGPYERRRRDLTARLSAIAKRQPAPAE
jgi:hypothetical protein